MIFGDLTTGPSNDLRVASALARDMVTKYGMSEAFGPVALEDSGGRLFWGGVAAGEREYSEEVSKKIDAEVARIIDEAKEKATKVIIKHRTALDAIAGELIKTETLERSDFEKLLITNGIVPK